MTQNNVIFAITSDYYFSSKDNDLPWKKVLKTKYNINSIKEDQKFFKSITCNSVGDPNVVIMGKNTYLSIGRPLTGRYNIVISKKLKNFTNTNYTNLFFVDSLERAIEKGKEISKGELFIIGGTENIKESLIQHKKYDIKKIFITIIDGIEITEGNKLFYEISKDFEEELIDEINSTYYKLKFIKFEKK